MIKKPARNELRKGKQQRIRRKVRGTLERPRLCVFRSLNHIYAQLIDDVNGRTLVTASTLDKEMRDQIGKGVTLEEARMIGNVIAKKALASGIEEVIFDRNGYKYHGKVAALADAAREGGLKF